MNGAPARLLVVAGSDSGGGAGIQADIKTATALGVYAMTAITAVTVQDTVRVHAIHPVPASIVRDQIACVLDDIGADAIKIGMLGSAAVVAAVADILEEKARGIPIVLDPVVASTSGTMLLDADGVALLILRLIPLIALLTPNLPETGLLSGMAVRTDEDVLRAAGALRALGARAALVKGGHAAGERVRDVLIGESGLEVFDNPRLGSAHGTGCTLASAIACGLAQRLPLGEAVRRARGFVQDALESAPELGRGARPLDHMHRVRDGVPAAKKIAVISATAGTRSDSTSLSPGFPLSRE